MAIGSPHFLSGGEVPRLPISAIPFSIVSFFVLILFISLNGSTPLKVSVTSGASISARDCPGCCADRPVSHSNTNNN
ncbi:MAG TPA: hypothetical protein VII73_06645 [Caulobacteraceae bacterium]